MKDKIEWFGEKGKEGTEVMKTAGKAIGAAVGLVVVGVALGAVGHATGWWGK
jgi:predicted ATP-dependent protease